MGVSPITFTDTLGVDEQYAPVPTVRALPKWYLDTAEYVSGKRQIQDGQTPHTVKKCVPVFDAMSAGYVVRSYVDVQVSQRDGLPYYEWPSMGAISFHPIEQAPLHPASNGAPYPKWMNPWAIKTRRGVSCLFIPPMHNPNGMFAILPGIVDTDTYTAPVNFPFVLNDSNWEGMIPAGTLIAQVIPFRRESFKMRFGNESDLHAQAKVTRRLRALWFHSYKRQFWHRKQWR